MKKILSLLLCYVFLQTETFALRGGPGNSGTLTVTGYYSGTMTDTTGSGNVGLFLIGATSAGASTGQFIIFDFSAASSNAYEGLITGLSDTSRGGTGKFVGVFSGSAVVSSVTATQSVSGEMTCSVSKTGSTQNLRLTGTATSETLTLFTLQSAGAGTGSVVIGGGTGSTTTSESVVGPAITYTIDGWQTSAPSSGSTGLTLGTGGS